jgi:GNAT superfamily N-acetyltransferase
MDDLTRALAFERSIRVRAAERLVALPAGVVVLHDGLPNKWHLNAVLLDAPLPADVDAAALSHLADEHLGERGHRHVVLDDGAAGERLAPELVARGWTVQRVVYLRWRHAPDRPARAGVARRIDGVALGEVQVAMAIEERDGRGPAERALIEALVGGEQALRSGTPAIGFGAGEDGVLSASCTLFLERGEGEGGVAMIDEVGTLAAARGRGFARAAVAAALEVARVSGCDPIIIPADVDDWPRQLYARMGFEPLGTQLVLTLANTAA